MGATGGIQRLHIVQEIQENPQKRIWRFYGVWGKPGNDAEDGFADALTGGE